MIVALDATPLILSSGGLPRYVTELSLALARGFPEDTYQLLSDQTFPLPADAPPNLVRGPLDAPGRRWWLSGARRAMRKSGAQLFHGTNFEVPYLGKTPSILTIHDLSPWRDPSWHDGADRVRRRTPWLVRLRRARLILTVSGAVRREIISFFGVEPGKVKSVPLAASPRFRPEPRKISDSPGARPFFLFVGTIEPRKNLAALALAWRETRDRTGADLVIAGRSRQDFVPLPAYDGLRLLGEVSDDDLPRLYSDALAFVYPSHYEGFGLPVLEAMQCGCPVIASSDPAVCEVSGSAAIHAGTAGELAEAMVNVASNPEIRSQMRAAGLARAAEFSWQSTAGLTRAIYAELIGEPA